MDARKRRALNIVWTAAGNHDFRPDFLAFHADGSPDVYLNAIVGLVYRHYEYEKIKEFIEELNSSMIPDTFTDLFWLALESAAYNKCIVSRPALRGLREENARLYLMDNVDASMQQLMMRDDLVHSVKAARCREVLGQDPGILNPWEKRLYESLEFDGELTTDEIILKVRAVFQRFFVFSLGIGKTKKALKFTFHGVLAVIMRKIFNVREGKDAAPRSEGGSSHNNGLRASLSASRKNDFKKIFSAFPTPLFSEDTMIQLQKELCIGTHRKSRLYFAIGRNDDGTREKNLAYYNEGRSKFEIMLRKLSARLKNSLEICLEPVQVRAGTGKFHVRHVWRAIYQNDNRVFHTDISSVFDDFSVTLFLDASYSRTNQQPVIASQAYIIAGAMARIGIPLQIISFCSIAGYTVLSRLKSFSDFNASGVFDYKAEGWNRDGLAVRSVEKLLPARSLLIMFTDANPSDDHEIPRENFKMSCSYGGEQAVADTAAEVSALRRRGVRVIGIVNSEIKNAGIAARKIFGSSQKFSRIEKIERMPGIVAGLIEDEIRLATG